MNIIEAIDDEALFAPWFPGKTWNPWRVILKGAFGLPMSAEEAAFFRSVADRDPPTEQVSELWIIAGRRAGKDSVASVIASHAAALFEDQGQLRPGERALVMCLANDRDQAKIVLNYCRSFFTDIPLLGGMVERETAYGFELNNKIDIAVSTNNFRAVRGRPVLCAILDEIAFWRDDTSATPDTETYNAIRPGTATMPGAMIIGISSPYRKSGLLYRKYRDHYGKPGKVLVVRAPTELLNPTIDPQIIADALAEDPAAARAEWLAEFRDDIAAFVTQEAIDACVSPGVVERSRVHGVTYRAFCDPSGGASDSMTLAIGHSQLAPDRKTYVAILDCLREIHAPFSPDAAVLEFATVLKSYGIRSVRGDRYAAEWVRDAFRKVGIDYRPADLAKSEIYRDFLPRLNSGEVDLLDSRRLTSQLLSLERRTARGGRDSIDHPPGGKDDLANAAAGCLVYLTSARHQPATAYTGTFTMVSEQPRGYAAFPPEVLAAQGIFHPQDRQKWIDAGVYKPPETQSQSPSKEA
ncbi:hypothetical protein [Bradyrhizobium sp. 6(2017)]|uniref:hypothetical protein n=1 Tax=Bradyrhizobium sp. 6(2017) TaxID=1197460 RepID=UPI00197B0311|nr:hypothetical protein [Bradyrhizobium sp. 6(2017)]